MNEKHYWIILFSNGTYLELYGTESYVDEYLARSNYTYRKIIWEEA